MKRIIFSLVSLPILVIICVVVSQPINLADSENNSESPVSENPSWKEVWMEGEADKQEDRGDSEDRDNTKDGTADESEADITVPTIQEYDIILMALGDNLLHEGIINTGRMNDGSYNYSFLFQDVADYLERADIKVINQETILGGNDLGFTGYPLFNSPTQVGDAISDAGFNVVLHATNHAADQGIQGIYHCAEFWKQYPEVLMTGISGAEDTERIHFLTIDTVTFAILNYTYGPNMAVLPKELRGHLNMLCDFNETSGKIDFTALNPQVTADIKEAKEKADVVIVFPHWGTEYQIEPSEYQRRFAMEMTEAGADVIIGTHPHVLQPIEWVVSENGNKALCYYSLGNYVSLQMRPLTMLEGMAWVTFHVTQDSVIVSEEKTGMLPLVCHYKSGSMHLEHIYLLEEYTEELASRHGIRDYKGERLHLADLLAWSEEIICDWALTSEELLK